MELDGRSKFFISGGTMPRDSASYIERSSDRTLLEALTAGRYCYVLNSRQMGKSSLSVQVMSKLDRAGVETALVDLTRIGGRNVTAGQWYAGLCDAVGEGFGLRSEMLDFYRSNSLLSPMQRFFGALEEIVLANTIEPVAIFVDEIDATKNLAFDADEFFAGIRECFNRRVQNEAFARLTFCLIGVAVPTDLIRNPSTTPFNIGERILLHDFTVQEMRSFSGALGRNGNEIVERIHYWTGGQPFLSQTLCQTVVSNPAIQTAADIDQLVKERMLDPRARITNINLADVGDRALEAGSTEPDPGGFRADLLAAYERAWRGHSIPDDESNRIAVMLKLSGLMRSDGRQLHVRNRIYHHVFDQKWIRDNTPERERLRERQAFRRGLFRAASASAFILGIVGTLALLALRSGQEAESARAALDYELYVANMTNMRLFEETGDVTRMDEVIRLTKNSPYRGFEWSFWQRRIHDSPEEYTLDYNAPGKREEGLISQDGRQICIHDILTGTAVVVDRHSKQPIETGKVEKEATVVATSKGFVVVRSENGGIVLTDLSHKKTLVQFGRGLNLFGLPILRERSDRAMSMIEDKIDHKVRTLTLWNLTTGHVEYQIRSADPLMPVALRFSQDGKRIVYGFMPSHGGQISGLHVIVRDVPSGQITDQFVLPVRGALSDFSDSGHLLLYQEPDHSTVCRNVDSHQIVVRRHWDGSALPIATSISTDDSAMAEYFPNGRASRVSFGGAKSVDLGQHVWRLSAADTPASLLADSTSVRILSTGGRESLTTVAQGIRITHSGRGEFAVFRSQPQGLDFYSPDQFKLTLHADAAKGIRGNFTYNGLWQLIVESGKDSAIFKGAIGKERPLRISPVPVNYSCGSDGNSLAILEKGGRKIDALQYPSGKVRWSYKVPGDPISGLWVSPSGNLVLALSGDTDLLVLDGKSGQLQATLGGHNVRLSNLTFTSDGNRVFTCGADGRVILWDLVKLARVQEYRGNVAQRMSSADLSPDGTRVATCNLAGSWQLWDAKTGVQLMEIRGSNLPLRSIMFSDDGLSIFTAGEDNQVRRWGTLTRDPQVRIPVSSDLLKGLTR